MTTMLGRHRTATYRVVLATAVLVALGLVLGWVAAPTIAYSDDEPATPTNKAVHDHTWSTTGCFVPGASLDAVPGVFDFQHACIHHGGCYQGLDRRGAPATIDRLRCDQLFHADLQASCGVMHGKSTNWRAEECRSTADSYYEVVRSFGAAYYTGSGSAA